jgi:hypothetical protein
MGSALFLLNIMMHNSPACSRKKTLAHKCDIDPNIIKTTRYMLGNVSFQWEYNITKIAQPEQESSFMLLDLPLRFTQALTVDIPRVTIFNRYR